MPLNLLFDRCGDGVRHHLKASARVLDRHLHLRRHDRDMRATGNVKSRDRTRKGNCDGQHGRKDRPDR